MSTSNFWYDHRCLFVTDEDENNLNRPAYSGWINGAKNYDSNLSRNYPARALEDWEDSFITYLICSVNGYYEGGCITALEVDDGDIFDEFMSYQPVNTENPTELAQLVVDFVTGGHYLAAKKSSVELIRKDVYDIASTNAYVFENPNDLEIFIEGMMYQTIIPNIREIEKREVDTQLDAIKKEYGYEELTKFATFSSGETIYKTI